MTAEELNRALFSSGALDGGKTSKTTLARFVFIDRNKKPGVCRVEIYRGEVYDLVVLTELKENTGMSVTNASECIATQVCQSYNLDPARTRWVECYRPDVSGYTEQLTHDEITYTWIETERRCVSPQWRYLSPEAFRRLIVERDFRPEEIELSGINVT